MGHCLVVADGLAKLLALVGVRHGLVKGALGETDHLRGNADAALVEDLDRVLVALALLADEVLERDPDLVKIDSALRQISFAVCATQGAQVDEARMPSLISFLAISTPCAFSTMKQEMPL